MRSRNIWVQKKKSEKDSKPVSWSETDVHLRVLYHFDPKFVIAVDAIQRLLPMVDGWTEDDRDRICCEFSPVDGGFTLAWLVDQTEEKVFQFKPDVGEWTVISVSFRQWLASALHAGKKNQDENLKINVTKGYGLLTDLMTQRQMDQSRIEH